jgi:hypothetical protein
VQGWQCALDGLLPGKLTFGLAWDVTDDVNIDLDASELNFKDFSFGILIFNPSSTVSNWQDD